MSVSLEKNRGVTLAKKSDAFWRVIGPLAGDFPPPPKSTGFRFMLNAIPDHMPVMDKTVRYFG